MNLNEIVDKIYQLKFGRTDLKTSEVYDRIIKKYTIIGKVNSKSEFKLRYASDDKQMLFFKYDDITFYPIPIENNNDYDFTYSIPSIATLNTKKTFNRNYIRNLKLLAFLLDYEFTDDELDVLEGKISDSNLRDTHIKEIASIESAERREIALAKIVYLLTRKDIFKLTFISNDLHFVLNIITSIVCFLDRDDCPETGTQPELCIMFDPASVSDIISFRIYLLKELGARVKILPIKNKYPYFGMVKDWVPGLAYDKASEFYIFRTFFFERQSNKDYFELITSPMEVKKMLLKIIESDQGGTNRHLPQSKELVAKGRLTLKKVKTDTYIEFLYKCFRDYKLRNIDKDIVYSNVKFSIQELRIDNLHYRTKSVIRYKVLQADEFIKKYENSIFKHFESEGLKGIECIPYDLSINNQLFPINPIFIEYNHDKQRYEVAEGHSRIWALYNYHGVQIIKTIVIENIQSSFFKPIESRLLASGMTFAAYNKLNNMNWMDTVLKRSDIDETEILLQPRMIESITHNFPDKVFKEMFDDYISKGILEKNDIHYSSKLKT